MSERLERWIIKHAQSILIHEINRTIYINNTETHQFHKHTLKHTHLTLHPSSSTRSSPSRPSAHKLPRLSLLKSHEFLCTSSHAHPKAPQEEKMMQPPTHRTCLQRFTKAGMSEGELIDLTSFVPCLHLVSYHRFIFLHSSPPFIIIFFFPPSFIRVLPLCCGRFSINHVIFFFGSFTSSSFFFLVFLLF